MEVQPKVDKPCVDCGEMMFGVTKRRRVCSKCAIERERAYNRERNKIERAQMRANKQKTPKPKPETIEDVNRKAIAAKMSYGQYVAMMNERKEKMK